MGVILWELLNKRRLFAGLGYDVIAKNIRTADVPLLEGDKALQLVLEKALEREPQKRFETVSEMRTELKATAPHTDSGEVAKLFENVLGSHPSIQRMREVAAEHTIRQPSRRRVPPVRPLEATPSGSFDVDNEPTSSGRPLDTFPPPIPTEEELDEPKRQIGRGELFAEIASTDATVVQMGRWLGAAGFARLITVTTLQEKYAEEDAVVGALVEDARIISRVKHPNLVPIHDLIDDEDELFVVMDYLDGVSLAHVLRQVKRREELVPIGIASRIISGVLHGLHAAHNAKGEDGEVAPVIHRNVCPDSVMLGADGYARLVDFGLERGLERTAHSRKRKWSYKAPEQVRKEDVEPRTDVYGASVLAYELFTGRRPYRGRGIRKKVLAGDPPKPTKLREALPPKLESFVLRGMALDSDDRWEDAEEMAEAIDRLPGMASHRDVVKWLRDVAGARLDHAQRLRRAVENAPVTLSADELEGPLSVSSAPRESLFEIEPPPEEPEVIDQADISSPDATAEVASEPPKERFERPAERASPVEPLAAETVAPPASSNTRTWLIAGAAAVVSAGLVALIMARGDGDTTAQPSSSAPRPSPVTATSAPVPSPIPPPTTVAAASGSTAASSSSPSPQPPPAPAPSAQWPKPKASGAWPPPKPEPPPEPTSTPTPPPTSSRRIPDGI
jgi:serine/threonine-protein kinase